MLKSLLIGTLLLATTSATARPAECRAGRGARGYATGYSMEKDFLRLLWDRFGGCERLEGFVGNLDVTLDLTPSPSDYIRCRNLGINNALAVTVEELTLECDEACVTNGAALGTLSSKLFCGSGIPYAQKVHVALCGEDAQKACAASLQAGVQANCPQRATDHAAELAQLAAYTCESSP